MCMREVGGAGIGLVGVGVGVGMGMGARCTWVGWVGGGRSMAWASSGMEGGCVGGGWGWVVVGAGCMHGIVDELGFLINVYGWFMVVRWTHMDC